MQKISYSQKLYYKTIAKLLVVPVTMRFLGKPTVFLIDNKESLRKYLLESFDADPRFTPEFCNMVKKSIVAK